MLCLVFVFSSVFRVFEEKQVFQASFRLKKQFGKKPEAIGLITALLGALDHTCSMIEMRKLRSSTQAKDTCDRAHSCARKLNMMTLWANQLSSN
jgi:hypothetical protein